MPDRVLFMRSFQHHITSEKVPAKVYLDSVDGRLTIRVTTEMPPESITIEVPMVQEIILGDE
jgi:hypothetical protein